MDIFADLLQSREHARHQVRRQQQLVSRADISSWPPITRIRSRTAFRFRICRSQEVIARDRELQAMKPTADTARPAQTPESLWPAVIRLDPTLPDETGVHGKEKVYGSIP